MTGGKSVQYDWRQFIVAGQTLTVYHHGKREHVFQAADVTVEHVSSHFYRLKAKPWHKLDISCPLTSRMERFCHVLHLAATTTPYWTPPQYDTWTNFLHVAKEINEAEAAAPTNMAVSTVTVAQVQAHLNEMLAIYGFQTKCRKMEQVYSHLLDLEADYCVDENVANYAHTVHRLHPVKRGMEHVLPGCGQALSVDDMYKFHIKGDAVPCCKCSNSITLGAFSLALFTSHYREITMDCELNDGVRKVTLDVPSMPPDGNVEAFMTTLRSRIEKIEQEDNIEGATKLRVAVRRHFLTYFNGNRSPFGFDLVKAMIRQLDFINKICPNYNYWSHAEVLQASIVRYHKFMHLMKIKKATDVLVPTADIDLVWHTHQADAPAYENFCST
ncbi:hypothetical protein AC1031_002644 [Aphanomyces cochlioides]|nr:hypothetical protein AC1031_002644 [Aphanomyces cochlioides]